MLENDTQQHLANYDFLIGVLHKMIEKTSIALKGDNRWFAFAPKVCQKFLNQAITLKLLFANKLLQIGEENVMAFEDLSAIYSLLRMQFETHALFYHLFMPCPDMQENIVRFRLWELDGIRYKMDKKNTGRVSHEYLKFEINYLPVVEKSITELKFFQSLDKKRQNFLLSKAAWRFSSERLLKKEDWQLSYEQLIRNTGVKDEIYSNLYEYFSLHTHPTYVSVIQTSSVPYDEMAIGKYLAILYACFVTSFLVVDFSKRFVQSGEVYNLLTENEKEVIQSFIKGGRN